MNTAESVYGSCECGAGEEHEYDESHGRFVEVMDRDAADERILAAMQSWLDEHAGDERSFQVRYPHRVDEAPGTYSIKRGGDLQILGYSVPVPEAVRDLIREAFEFACMGK